MASRRKRIFEKRWAATLLENVLARLRQDYLAHDKALLFDALKPYVCGDTITEGYEEVAGRLGMSAGAVRVGHASFARCISRTATR
jgi:hypothetical protein